MLEDYSIQNLLFWLSELALLLSFMMTNMLVLRSIVCLSDVGFIIAASLVGAAEPGMSNTIVFSALSLIVNFIHILRLSYSHLPARIPKKLGVIYHKFFSTLYPMEFLILFRAANEIKADNQVIIEEGQSCDLFMLTEGSVNISRDNMTMQEHSNSVLGELNFLTKRPAIATVKATGRAVLYSWTEQSLNEIRSKYPELYLKLYDILLIEIRKKILHSSDQLR